MNKENEFENNLEKEAPLLSGIPKNNPFVVPEAYFNSLPSLIMEKCRESSKNAPTTIIPDKIFWLFRPQWIVAVFIAIVGICFVLRRDMNNSAVNYESIAASIPDSVILQHLQNNIDYVDVSNLEEMAQSTGNIGSLPSLLMQDTAKRQIINYLMSNNIDASEIENEL